MLDHGESFIDLEHRDDGGRPVLLRLARNYFNGYDVSKVKLLLERGANIHVRDYQGRTCLHTAVLNADRPYELEREMKVLVLLIRRGADIFSTDNSGRSIFDDAYGYQTNAAWSIGGYRGVLWDAALSQCGYGRHIRISRKDIYYFTIRYTKEHFAQLWKGRECECPYASDLFDMVEEEEDDTKEQTADEER